MGDSPQDLRKSVLVKCGSKDRSTITSSGNDDPLSSTRSNRLSSINQQSVLRRFTRSEGASVRRATFQNGRYTGSVLINRSVDGGLKYNNSNEEENERKESLRRRRMLTRLTSSTYHNVPIECRDFNTNIRKSVLSEFRDVTDQPPEAEEKVQEKIEEDPNIDGGWAWMVMFVSLVLIILVDGVAFSFGTLFNELTEYFGVTAAEISLVNSLQTGFYLGMGPVASILIEKFGYRAMGITGSLISCVGFVAASFSPKSSVVVLILTYGVMGGFGFCLIFMTSMVATSLYFNKKRPIAVGIASCGSGIGIFVFPMLMNFLLKILSWQNCIRIQAGIMLVGVFASIAFRPIKPKATVAAEEPNVQKRSVLQHLKSLVNWKLFTEPMFILLMVGAVFATLGIAPPFIYIIGMATERGVNNTDTLVSIMGGTNTAGRVLAGAAVFFNLANPMIVVSLGCLVGGIATVLSFFYHQYALLAVYSAFHGLVYAVDAALSTEILARTLGTEALSGAFGLICLCRGIAISMATPIGGALKDATGTYDATFYLAGGCILVNAVVLFIGYIIVRNRGEALDESFDYDVTENDEQKGSIIENIPEEEDTTNPMLRAVNGNINQTYATSTIENGNNGTVGQTNEDVIVLPKADGQNCGTIDSAA